MNSSKIFHGFLILALSCSFALAIGIIFNDIVYFPAGGLNRFLFIYLVPLIIFMVKLRARQGKSSTKMGIGLVGLSIGLYLSDITDFAMALEAWGGFFTISFLVYSYVLTLLYMIKKERI